jgi:hypothetical protein
LSSFPPASAAATNVETDSIMLKGTITKVWIDQSASIEIGLRSNDTAVSDTVVNTDAAKAQILVVLEDFTSILADHITNENGSVVEVTIL